MKTQFSDWSDRIQRESGIISLMSDLGNASGSAARPLYMLGGGNPAKIPEIQRYFRVQMENLMRDSDEFERLIGHYAGPQGSRRFVQAITDLLRAHCGWEIGCENIAVTNGSQMAFTILFKLFAGKFSDGRLKRILLPSVPEYVGYNEADEETRRFQSVKPQIAHTSAHTFRYQVDFDALQDFSDIGAICLSRPTNPTGSVISDEQLHKLALMAQLKDVPLIVDGAYGLPFPAIVFSDASVAWHPHVILTLSLSKLGLPGTRTGIIIAAPEIIEMVSYANAITTLASGSFGSILALEATRSGDILNLSNTVIQPYYKQARDHAIDQLHRQFASVPYALHECEGAFFLWLWFPQLPITNLQLYENLKKRNVYIIPGKHFFPGLTQPWEHQHECIRISYAVPEKVLNAALAIIADEVAKAYESQPKLASL